MAGECGGARCDQEYGSWVSGRNECDPGAC